MNEILNFLKDYNILTLVFFSLVIWYFIKDIKKTKERVSRLEITTYGKESCDFNEKNRKK